MIRTATIATTLAAIAAALLLPGQIAAQMGPGGPHGPGPGMDMDHGRLAEALQLSESQVSQIMDLMTTHREEQIRARAEAQILEGRIHQELRQLEPSLEQLEALAGELAVVRRDMQIGQFTFIVNVNELLTAEQRERFRQFRTMRARMHGMAGHGPGHRGAGPQGREGAGNHQGDRRRGGNR